MPGFKFNTFSGLLPRLSASLLPPAHATIARNCDFGYGELRNIKGDFNIQTMSNVPTSIYTDDGMLFYSWPNDVDAVRSPLSRDTFDRLYYTTPTDFRVTTRSGMSITGGQPGSSYRVGVPKPTVAPTFTVEAAPSLGNAAITAKFHYEYAGVKYQEQDIALTEVTAKEKWRYTPPAKKIGDTSTTGKFKVTAYLVTVTHFDSIDTQEWREFSKVMPITATSASSFVALEEALGQPAGTSYTATMVKDEFGLAHEMETLFSLMQYGVLLPEGVSQVDAATSVTPTQAFPVIRLTAKNAATEDIVFDIYSANSSFVAGSQWHLSISKDESPATTFTLALSYGANDGEKQTRSYLYTFVNTYNEEGPASPVAEITAIAGLAITVGVTRDVQSCDYAPIKEIRIYHTPDGSDIPDYFYVGSISVLTASGTEFTFVDNVKASSLNDPIESLNYYPPDPALVGLMQLPNGILTAWKGNELHFSDPYKPWSWPPQYVKTFQHNIVGGMAHGSGALITTLGQPFLISGVSPDTMTETKLKITQAGVSKWALADVGGIIVYASNDGIVAVEGGQATMNYSEQFFTRDVWRALYRTGFSSMRFAVWDGRLIVYSSSGAFTPFMIRLDEAKGAMTELPEFAAACSFVSPLSDQCYFTAGNKLYQFAGGAELPAEWQSRELVVNGPINFGIAQFVGTGNWSIQFYSNNADGDFVLRHTKTVTRTELFRLPSGFTSDRWRIKVAGSGRFRELYVARNARELGEV
jgi:hypothetical protein